MKSFGLTNFKSFASKQTIPVKPITLIYGANSAGKSSILQGFLLLLNLLKTGKADVSTIVTSWDNLDIGGFKQYVYKHKYRNMVELVYVPDGEENIKWIINIGADTDNEGNLLDKPATIANMEINADDEPLIKFTRASVPHSVNQFKISYFNFDHTWWGDREKIDEDLIAELTFDFDRFITSHSKNSYNFFLCNSCFFGLEIGTEIPEYFVEFICGIFTDYFLLNIWHNINVKNSLSTVNYIGPLRDYPPRVISDEQLLNEEKNHTWSILLKNAEVREKVNQWIGNNEVMDPAYELTVENKVEPNSFVEPLIELFSQIDLREGYIPEELSALLQIDMEYDENGDPLPAVSVGDYSNDDLHKVVESLLAEDDTLDVYRKLLLIDKRSNIPVSLRDVGVGISQVLPVLVNAYSPENDVVAVEQPEIHLHPKLQSELADVFIDAALGEHGKTFLIETHSEHLLLRIMRRIRETTSGELPEGKKSINPEDVQILFVMPSQHGEGSIVKKIALDKDGEMIDIWPGGFFEEGFNERFGL